MQSDRSAIATEDVTAVPGFPGFDVDASSPVLRTPVRKLVERDGSGAALTRGSRVSFVAVAWYLDGTPVRTQTNYASAFVGKIGADELPAAYEVAVSSMTNGEQSLFLVPETLDAGAAANAARAQRPAALVVRIDLRAVVPPLTRESELTKDPFSAVAVFGDALLCIAGGRFQPLWGEYAHVVQDAMEDVVTIDTLARRHELHGEDLELYEGLFDHLVRLGVLQVHDRRASEHENVLDNGSAKVSNSVNH